MQIHRLEHIPIPSASKVSHCINELSRYCNKHPPTQSGGALILDHSIERLLFLPQDPTPGTPDTHIRHALAFTQQAESAYYNRQRARGRAIAVELCGHFAALSHMFALQQAKLETSLARVLHLQRPRRRFPPPLRAIMISCMLCSVLEFMGHPQGQISH
jgi:hypothetical protein